jgi:hypothetical protein
MNENIKKINILTGEIIERLPKKEILPVPKYVRVTTTALRLSPIHIKVGILIATIVDSESNEFYITSEFKKKIKEGMNIQDPRYFQLLAEIKRDRMIIQLSKTKRYMLNPYYFFRCVANNRIKLEKKYDRFIQVLFFNRGIEEEISRSEFNIPPR